mmetsp:Transcript_9923/g.25616  ORF Transcript_9923/g.25616 Transcript_9923/m.25616 type:complete len:275 (+) Transcript_9923:480-1304(+)
MRSSTCTLPTTRTARAASGSCRRGASSSPSANLRSTTSSMITGRRSKNYSLLWISRTRKTSARDRRTTVCRRRSPSPKWMMLPVAPPPSARSPPSAPRIRIGGDSQQRKGGPMPPSVPPPKAKRRNSTAPTRANCASQGLCKQDVGDGGSKPATPNRSGAPAGVGIPDGDAIPRPVSRMCRSQTASCETAYRSAWPRRRTFRPPTPTLYEYVVPLASAHSFHVSVCEQLRSFNKNYLRWVRAGVALREEDVHAIATFIIEGGLFSSEEFIVWEL